MRNGLIGSWSGGAACLLLAGACSNIIGVSDYQIDPSLDPHSGEGGESGQKGERGKGSGGSSHSGSSALGGEGGGGDSGPVEGGAAGGGGEPSAGGSAAGACESAADCDDDIDCTVDTCDALGMCSHKPTDSLCDADMGECVTCVSGIGCVAAELEVQQLLLDPNLDEASGDWEETIYDNPLQESIINPDAKAQSGKFSAWWLPTEDPADDQGYADLFQYVTVPVGTRSLRATGFYKMTGPVKEAPGRPLADDYVECGLFSGTTELIELHTWYGDEIQSNTWVPFDYTVDTASKLAKVVNREVSYDLFGETWDSTFRFDTLTLEASVCAPPP